MTITRRASLLAALAGTAQAQAQAQAQAPTAPEPWPGRPVRIIVPAPGGAGTADTIARIFAQEMEKLLPQRVIVENRGGANGNIGAVAAARAAPDGYSLLWSWAGTLATNPALYRNLPFDPVRDFEPVILVGNVPNLLVVNRQMGLASLEQFTTYARENPGTINFGSTGNGSSMHLAGELFKSLTGTQMTHVPYTGPAGASTDLLSGRIQAMFNLVTGAAPQIRSGEVVPIAVLSPTRVAQLPDVPTTAELGMPGLVFGTWFGVLVPKGTDAALVSRLNTLANQVLANPEARTRLQAAGLDILGGPPARLADHLREEIARHAVLVRASGAQLD